jgi:2-oxoglutarate dehydrogenase E1 component
MGAWTYVEHRIGEVLPDGRHVRYVGRAASASPATGSYTIHNLEQEKLVSDSLRIDTDVTSAASEPKVAEKVAPASS